MEQIQVTHKLELPSLPHWRRYVNPWRVVPLAIMLSPWANHRADLVLSTLPDWPSFSIRTATPAKESPASAVSPHNTQPIRVGDKIAGYKVTSAFGLRRAPCPGCSSMHPAIDLATPAGTPVYAPAPVKVVCKTEGKAGNYAEFEMQGIKHQLLHLSVCRPGDAKPGQVIGATGGSGAGTGPHLDVRVKQDGERVLPSMEVITAMLDPNTVTDQTLKTAIGGAEGTVNADGTPTRAYSGHTDPGNGKRNQGAFSYQHGAETPEQADERWLQVLRKAEQDYQAQAKAIYGHELSRAALVAILDAHTQSPDAAKRFLKFLPTYDPTPEQIVSARIQALKESRRVMGGPPMNVPADQQRRVQALLNRL